MAKSDVPVGKKTQYWLLMSPQVRLNHSYMSNIVQNVQNTELFVHLLNNYWSNYSTSVYDKEFTNEIDRRNQSKGEFRI